MHLAADGGYEEVVQLLVQHGAEINALDRNSTALAEAARFGRVSTVQLLLRLGADPQIHNFGFSPLWTAARAGCLELVRLFIELGLNVDGHAGPWQPRTRPTNVATSYGHNCVVNLLLELGAKPACDCAVL